MDKKKYDIVDIAFVVIYTLAAVVITLDIIWWRPQ